MNTDKSFESNNIALLVIAHRGRFIPIAGINRTAGGWFINYYLNDEARKCPWFGPDPHESRHPTLIAGRISKEVDVYSVSQGIGDIDARKTPEELAWRTVLPDFMLPWMDNKSINGIRRVLRVPVHECITGVDAKVVIYPAHLQPTSEEMTNHFTYAKGSEAPARTFTLQGLSNRIAIAVYPAVPGRIRMSIPIPMDGMDSFKRQPDGSLLSTVGVRLGKNGTPRVPQRKKTLKRRRSGPWWVMEAGQTGRGASAGLRPVHQLPS